jgi:iron-sulfur cluster assembly protein
MLGSWDKVEENRTTATGDFVHKSGDSGLLLGPETDSFYPNSPLRPETKKAAVITLSESALQEFARRLADENKSGHAIRFGLRPGGCAGTKYLVEFTIEEQDNDHVFEQGGLRVLCDPISLSSLSGLQVDYVEALMGGGFRYDNPNATTKCACGDSFGAG